MAVMDQRRDLVRVVEAAYQIELEGEKWLQGLADILGEMHGGEHGLMVYEYDASVPEEGVGVPAYALCGLDQDFARGTILHHRHSPPEDTRRVYHWGVRCSTVSEVLAERNLLPREHESFGRFRGLANNVEDAWGVSASNPDGRGIGIAAPLEQVTSMSEGMRELWGLVGVHLATAYRLRRGGAAKDRCDAAILDPGGNLVHTEGQSYDDSSRSALEQATRNIDRARTTGVREDPTEALPLWEGLVEGRWSLVDRWDSDGRRYVVAHPNDPRFDKPEPLTHRERQVVAYASQGDSNGRISYSLGLGEDVVEALLSSAMNKLGVDTREALIRLRRDLPSE